MSFWKRTTEHELTDDLRIIVGLGNPGGQYANTRHNIGFMVLDRLAAKHNLRFKKSKHRADVARGSIGSAQVLLALPLTYMNESGNAVSRLIQYYRVAPASVVVVCDDLDLPFGTLRVRSGGSSGGNNGLASIIQAVGTKDFPRVRLGVGRPRGSAVGHVLGPFPPSEARALPGFLDVAADAVECVLQEGVEAAMNSFNRDWWPEITAG